MRHFDELELLESHYLPDSAKEQRQHLADCQRCRVRLDRVSAALLRSAEDLDRQVDALPDTFWQRQRASIQRDLRRAPLPERSWRRYAVAASVGVLMTAGLMFRSADRTPVSTPDAAPAVAEAPLATEAIAGSGDPWDSGELSSYRAVVDWESWDAAENTQGES